MIFCLGAEGTIEFNPLHSPTTISHALFIIKEYLGLSHRSSSFQHFGSLRLAATLPSHLFIEMACSLRGDNTLIQRKLEDVALFNCLSFDDIRSFLSRSVKSQRFTTLFLTLELPIHPLINNITRYFNVFETGDWG